MPRPGGCGVGLREHLDAYEVNPALAHVAVAVGLQVQPDIDGVKQLVVAVLEVDA